MLFVPTEPVLETTPLEALDVKLIAYEEPLQLILPAVYEGFKQDGHCIEGNVILVDVPHPTSEPVTVTAVPLGILIILSPLTVPAVAVTDTLLFNFEK